MSIKDHLQRLQEKTKRKQEAEEQEKNNLDKFINQELKELIDKAGIELLSMGYTFDANKSSQKHESDTWIIKVTNGDKSKEISISPGFNNKRNQKLGEEFYVTYDHIAHVTPKQDLISDFDSIIAKALEKII